MFDKSLCLNTRYNNSAQAGLIIFISIRHMLLKFNGYLLARFTNSYIAWKMEHYLSILRGILSTKGSILSLELFMYNDVIRWRKAGHVTISP